MVVLWKQNELHSTAEMQPVLESVIEAMTSAGYVKKDLHAVRLAVEEAVVNAIRHGHCGDPSKTVRVDSLVSPEAVFVKIEDEGPGFDPHGLADPREPLYWERAGGRGVLLIRAFASWVQYSERGNAVTLCRRRSA